MLVGVIALIGVILLALAGFNLAAPNFSPGWLGLAFVALALTWPAISHLG